MQSLKFPLNEVQISLLKLTEKMSVEELQDLRKLILAYKAQRLAMLADEIWEAKGWTQETMNQFLNTHLRTPYKHQKGGSKT